MSSTSATRFCSRRQRIALAIVVILAVACAPRVDEGRVFAAASIADVCERVAAAADLPVVVQPAASSTLAQQILAGARADVFVSAHTDWIDALAREGLIEPGSRRRLANNDLVVVRAIGAAVGPLPRVLMPGVDLAGAFAGRLAVGDPSHVPVGRYAREALEALGAWRVLEDRLAPAPDARTALAFVERGACAAGIVYRTDAAASRAVEIVAELPAGVVYEVALLLDSSAVGRAFYAALCGDAGRDALAAAGFAPPEQPR